MKIRNIANVCCEVIDLVDALQRFRGKLWDSKVPHYLHWVCNEVSKILAAFGGRVPNNYYIETCLQKFVCNVATEEPGAAADCDSQSGPLFKGAECCLYGFAA